MTKAIILAAGEGKRLRPLTNDRPKCAVVLGGLPLIERQISTLQACGVTDIHLITGYLSNQLNGYGTSQSINHNYQSSNMVESLFSGLKFIEACEEDLLISYGDIIYSTDNLQELLKESHDVTVMVDKDWYQLWSLRLDNPLDDAETMLLADDGKIIELGKKPDSYRDIHGQYTGLFKVSAKRLRDLINFYNDLDKSLLYEGSTFKNMYMTTFIQLLIDSGWQVFASMVENGWLEVDTKSDLDLYENLISSGSLMENLKLKK